MFNIKFMGVYKNEEQLVKGEISEKFQKYDEPESITKAFIYGFLMSMPIFILVGVFIWWKLDVELIDSETVFNAIGISCMIGIITLVIHEIVHALCYPLEYKKEIWAKPNEGAMFMYCHKPIRKKRFIFMCLCPNIVLGFLPVFLWGSGIFGYSSLVSLSVVISGSINIISGIGDYYNVYLTVKQVPKDSLIQLYGFHTYWISTDR